MQKMGDRLGVNAQNFKLKFAQFKNDAKGMTDATKKWFKKVVGQMRTWFRKNAKKLIDSKPMQKAYERLEDISVKRIVPKGDMPEVAKSEESTEETHSVLMDYIEKNGGLPKKSKGYKQSGHIAKFYHDVMIPISTRLGRIHPALKRIIRKYHERADINTGRDMLNIEGFVEKMEKLRKSNRVDHDKLDISLLNGKESEIQKLIKKHDMVEEYELLREVLDGIYERAIGLDKEQYARYRELKDFILPDLKNTPKKSWKKGEIIDWLKRQKVKHNPLDTKAELLKDSIKKAKSEAGKYKNLKKEFDDLEAEVTYDIPYYKNYHPREVDDYQGLENLIIGSGLEGELDLALLNKAKSLGITLEQLTEQQKADAINMHFRNTTGTLSTSAKNLKKRKFTDLDAEMSKYYKDSTSSLLSYVPRMNEAIARAKLFGRGSGVVGANVENLDEKSIGAFIQGLKAGQKKTDPIITTENEKEIEDIFMAKFGKSNFTSEGIQNAKNLVYMASIGDLLSTLTQFGDLGFAAYRAKNPLILLKAINKGVRGKSTITAKDIGMDRISAEYSRDQLRSSKALGNIFKRTGFARIDRLGKEVLVNTVIESMRAEARSKGGLKAKNMDMINAAFGENSDKAKDVVETLKKDFSELKDQEKDDVISLAYWALLEHQPVAESEMPAAYLRSNTGKLLYQLKTWGIKALDVFRNEAYDKINTKGQRLKGLKNLGHLAVVLTMANVPPDIVKSIILGKPINGITDLMFDNILKLFFISKFDFNKRSLKAGNLNIVKRKFSGLVPFIGKLDDIGNDLFTLGKWFTTGLSRTESLYYDMKTPQSIPYLGRLLTHRGWDLGTLDWGGARGREIVVKKEIEHYKEIQKERLLNDIEWDNYMKANTELGKIKAVIAQGSKGGFVWQWLGWDEEVYKRRF